MVHAATLGKLGLGEAVALAQLDDLHGDVVGLLEDFSVRLRVGRQAVAASGRDVLVVAGHGDTSSASVWGIPHESSTTASPLLPALPTLPLLELAEQPASLGDLTLLSALLRVIALVVAAEEQHDLLAIEVHEDPEQDLLRSAVHLGRVAAEHADDLVSVVANAELVEPFAEGLQPLGPDEIDPSNRKHPIDGGVERDELEVRQVVEEPLKRDGPVVGLEGFRCPLPRHTSFKLQGWDGIPLAPANPASAARSGIGCEDGAVSGPTVVLGIELMLRTTEAGGRSKTLDPSWYQYRPNWGFAGIDHPRGQVGAPVLCWRDSPMTPGDTTFVAIQPMYPEHWGDVAVGDVLYLYEGVRLCGLGLVGVREDLPEGPRPLELSEAVRWSAWVHLGEAPDAWPGVDQVVTVDGVLPLLGSTAGGVLVPAHLSYDEQQELGVSLPWAAGLVVNGETMQRAYGTGPDPLLAVFAGEQRWLVEEKAAGAAPGATYVEKARRRLHDLGSTPLIPATAGRLGLPSPWLDLTGADDGSHEDRAFLLNELRNELRQDHDLFGLDIEVVARCDRHCDDIVLRSPDAWWRVHLTYSKNERPPWPMTDRFDSTLGLVTNLTSGEHEIADFVE